MRFYQIINPQSLEFTTALIKVISGVTATELQNVSEWDVTKEYIVSEAKNVGKQNVVEKETVADSELFLELF